MFVASAMKEYLNNNHINAKKEDVMNPRLEKLRQEREKLAEKLTSLTARLKALDEQILKLENTDIVGIVRENGLTIEQLAALMAMLEKRPTAALPDEYRKTEDFTDEE